MTKTEIKNQMKAKLQNCKLISVGGANYFGELLQKNKDGVTIIQNAVEAKENLEQTVKHWMRCDQTCTLQKLELTGETSIVSKEMNEDQLDTIELLIIQASTQISKALPTLFSEAIK